MKIETETYYRCEYTGMKFSDKDKCELYEKEARDDLRTLPMREKYYKEYTSTMLKDRTPLGRAMHYEKLICLLTPLIRRNYKDCNEWNSFNSKLNKTIYECRRKKNMYYKEHRTRFYGMVLHVKRNTKSTVGRIAEYIQRNF